jgi:hypothetical protein
MGDEMTNTTTRALDQHLETTALNELAPDREQAGE